MSAKERLLSLQPALEERGVRDVKFCFAPGVTGVPLSQVQERVYDLIDAYLKERVKRVERVGDAPVMAAA
ncbi:hypothetical protein [Delftia acidovorans]|uniref:hypothetical protein n=1 Tax=Delftia acidovorans TaxID=80866 RepID=UPI001EDD5D4A|nr:hypothetical protein [Delftia acidovorans]MCG3785752.1 hypothetical protein [Delftia acidovorans]